MPRLLIVEDNADLLLLLQELFARDYEVETARSGAAAVAQVGERLPDLIIMDLQLPEMGGLEAARRIQEALAPDRVPIVALTALAQSGDPEAVLATGHFDAYIAKPAPFERIRSTVDELLGLETGAR